MDRLIRLLLDNPFLLLILLAWIGGAIANAAKAAKKARERAEQSKRREADRRDEARAQRTAVKPVAAEPIAAEPRETEAARSAEEVAAEMRRILGMEGPLPRSSRRPLPEAEVAVEVPSPSPPSRPLRRNVVVPEPAPRPVVPTTQARSLEIHVDPHVGESIKGRHLASAHAGRGAARDLGSLGGRVHQGHAARRRSTSRYAIEDLKKAFIVNEILGPPLALRGPEERLR